MADFWNTDWLNRSEIFAPLRAVGASLPEIGWPNTEILNGLATSAGRVVNAQGLRVRFVPPQKANAFDEAFEPRTFLTGEVQVRPLDWHDVFNALVWMTFPTSKAVINARHYELLSGQLLSGESLSGQSLVNEPSFGTQAGRRPPARDALTLFDEDGVLVASSDAGLLQLVREFRWKELFWNRRDAVRSSMRFFVFGHALYQKSLAPFIGMTGKAVLLHVPADFYQQSLQRQIDAADRLLAVHIWDRERMCHGRELWPLPILGVPGWWAGNEQESFYDNTGYFRSGRNQAAGTVNQTDSST
ncbi:MAG: DUF3025 domain-containing protein [Burkholderiales bacterium]|jgi:hypothetical protein